MSVKPTSATQEEDRWKPVRRGGEAVSIQALLERAVLFGAPVVEDPTSGLAEPCLVMGAYGAPTKVWLMVPRKTGRFYQVAVEALVAARKRKVEVLV